MAENNQKTKASKTLVERAAASAKLMFAPSPEAQLYRDLTNDIFHTKFKNLNGDHSTDVSRFTIYQQYCDGIQWRNINRDPNRTKLTRNLCARIVKVKGGLLGVKPIISIPKESERSIKGDMPEETGMPQQDLGDELDKVDVQQKIIRNWVRESQYERILKEGGKSASKFGVRYNYIYWDKEKKRPVAEELFPGLVRVKYKDAVYNDILYAFVSLPLDIDEIKRRYNIEAVADKSTDLEYFRTSQTEYSYIDETRNQALTTHFFGRTPHVEDGKVIVHALIINQEVVWYEKWPEERVPIFPHRKDPQPGRRQGTSDLVEMVNTKDNGEMSLQDDYNITNSDELDLIGLYAWPRIVINTDGKIDVGVLQSTKARIIKVPKDSRVGLLEFTGKVYEISVHRDNLINDIARVTGVPKSALGVPDTSILTGAGINAEWQPLISEARDEFIQNLSLVITEEIQYVSALYRKYGGKEKETEKKYSDLLPEKLEVKVEPGLQIPREEQGWINMVATMKRDGLISISTGIKLLKYVESPDDEMKTITKELLDPRYNPELAIKVKQMEMQDGAVDSEVEEDKAYDENMQMAKGTPVGVSETKPEQHRIHILTHQKFISSSAYKALGDEKTKLFDSHIQEHENSLQRGGGEAAKAPQGPAIPKPEVGSPPLGQPGMSMFPNPNATPAPSAGPAANQPGQQPIAAQPPNAPPQMAPIDYNK